MEEWKSFNWCWIYYNLGCVVFNDYNCYVFNFNVEDDMNRYE